MSDTATLESRLEAVERQVAELNRHFLRPSPPRPWYESMIGSMKDYPEFDEVVRLGRAIRKSDGASSVPE